MDQRDDGGEVGRLAEAVLGLAQAVDGIGVVLEQHGVMLQRLLEASVGAPKVEVQLHELLVALIGRLDRQAEALGQVEKGMGQIGMAVGQAGRGTGK